MQIRNFLKVSVYGVLCLAVLAQGPLEREGRDAAQARARHFRQLREYPFGSYPRDARLKAIEDARRLRTSADTRARTSPFLAQVSALRWTMIGPQPIADRNSGRITALAVDPRDSNVVYAGSAEGGVWKTVDGGQHWIPITDNEPALAVGAIALDPSNPNIVYVGTGELNNGADQYGGAGILKSTDRGQTWQNIVGPFAGLSIGAIAVSPTDSNIVMAAGIGGIFRSRDAGLTWSNVLRGLVGSEVVFDPGDGQVAYAGLGYLYGDSKNGIYKSTDGGVTWSPLNTALASFLDTTDIGRVTIAVAPSKSSRIIAGLQSVKNFGQMIAALSSDGGRTWTKVSGTNYCEGNCWYNNVVRFSPYDANVLVGGGSSLFASFDGGSTWQRVNHDGGKTTSTVHPDVHAVAFSPRDPSRIYVGTDGGVVTTAALSPLGAPWTNLSDTLSVTQFYQGMSLHPTDPNITFAGTQDNGTLLYQGNFVWQELGCGDGMATAIDPINPANVYIACYDSLDLNKSTAGGLPGTFRKASSGIEPGEWQFFPVVAISASNPNQLYYGGTRHVYQTQDGAAHWTPISPDLTSGRTTVCAAAVAPSDPNTVYAATCGGGLWSTTNAAAGAASNWTNQSAGLPNRAFTGVAVDRSDPKTAYVAVQGFQSGHVYKTTDGGSHWTNISGDLPDIPASAVEIDPDLPDALYLATDIGVFWTTDGGVTWSPLATGLPIVAVRDLKLHRPSRILRAVTHGRGAWDLEVPLTGLNAVPHISSLVPAQVAAGSQGVLLKINGANFSRLSQVSIGGSAVATNFVSATEVDVTLPASAVAAPGSSAVTVSTAPPGGGTSNAVPLTVSAQPSLTSVASAASLQSGPVSPGEQVVLTGTNLTTGVSATDASGAATSLAGTAVTVTDSAGVSSTATLYSAAPTRITAVIPPGAGLGSGTLTVARPDLGTASVAITIQAAAPALFSADRTGTGYAAAVALTQAPDLSFVPQCPTAARCLPTPVDFPNGGPAWLQFSATGVSGADPASATLSIGGQNIAVTSISEQPGVPGVELVVAALPNTLFASGMSTVSLSVGGVGSNSVSLDFGSPASAAALANVEGMAVDAGGNLVVSDRATHRVYRITPSGLIGRIGGTTAGFAGDGALALSAKLNDPRGVAVDSSGNLYVADSGNRRVRRIAPDGTISTYAACASLCLGLAVDPANTVFIVDFYAGVSKVVNGSRIAVAGGTKTGFSGDGGLASAALLDAPYSAATDGAGNLYIADSGNSRVRAVDRGGTIQTVAGGGTSAPAASPQPAGSVQLLIPRALAADGTGNVYVADLLWNSVLQIAANGSLTMVVGSGTPGFGGDGGPANAATLHGPSALALDGVGNLYIADTLNGYIRKVTPDGNISTIAGTGN